MSAGKEYLRKVQDALTKFEEAIVARGKRKPLQSEVPLQQDVDRARKNVVDVVVELVTAEKMKQGAAQ